MENKLPSIVHPPLEAIRMGFVYSGRMVIMKTFDVRGMRLACRMRPGSSEAVVFIHGLADAGSSFAPLFEAHFLENWTLAALDMPGCGDSGKPLDFSYSMKDQADLVLQFVRDLDFEKVILAGHSMGGVIALIAAETLPPERVGGFINIEGNLTLEDCFFSRKISSFTEKDFEEEGFKTIVRMLRRGTPSDPGPVLEKYTHNFSRALPRAVHRSSVSLVEESRHGRLMERFRDLPAAKGYISGERSRSPSVSEYLSKNGIPHLTVPKSGHFMMVEQPDAFRGTFRLMMGMMGREGTGAGRWKVE